MKLPNFRRDSQLNRLRKIIGTDKYGSMMASPTGRVSERESQELESAGISLDSLDELLQLDDGTLCYKNRRVIVHIEDSMDYGGWGEGELHRAQRENLPRFHLVWCQKLKERYQAGTFNRYRIASRDDGMFRLRIIRDNRVVFEDEVELNVCMLCLDKLRYDGFRIFGKSRAWKRERVARFQLNEFFTQYPKNPINVTPKFQTGVKPPNLYRRNWPEIATRIKQKRGYRCDECGIDLSASQDRVFLHAHHISADKTDNCPENIRILCVYHHAEQPHHDHMKRSKIYRRFLQMYGERQSL